MQSAENAWRDIHRSEPVEITAPALEPLSRREVKMHLRVDRDLTDEDPWIDAAIVAARRLLEHDLDKTFVRTVWEMVFDRFPGETVMPLPRPPLVSVTSITSIDDDGVETTMSSSDYLVDTSSQPGRVVLAPDTSWPDDVRYALGGKVRWTGGYSAATKSVSSLTHTANVATVTTSAAHGYATGQRITIAGADQEGYNGTFLITVTSTTEFTYVVTGSPSSPATGTIVAVALGIPDRYLHAMLLLIGHWYRTREGAQTDAMSTVPLGYEALTADRLVGIG